ncbi:MAG: pyridoxal 5'-phosphate synthase glutaminase subunit PdxT [Dehalococcoidia bacterium]|jgi:5'-phosphate synthase pdxT subunit
MRIGVLASQGAFAEHIDVLKQLDIEAVPVRLPREFTGMDGLIIPGGESTTISRLIAEYQLEDEIKGLVKDGKPVFGTCAGMIMLSKNISGNTTRTLGLMDVRVKRNAFGRQRESFETDLEVPALGNKPFPAVFIRAPLIESFGDDIEILAKLPNDTIVAARQGKILVTAFHPELTSDLRFHRYFLNMIEDK